MRLPSTHPSGSIPPFRVKLNIGNPHVNASLLG